MPTCPHCGAETMQGAPTCAACGTALTTGRSDARSRPQEPDIRERVRADRGLIKKIQLKIPGWREYREKEDLRIADSILREQIASRMNEQVLTVLEDAQHTLAERLDLPEGKDMGSLIRTVRQVTGTIEHAEQGYSGISSAYKIDEDSLNRMYEFDWNLITAVEDLEAGAAQIRATLSDRGQPPLDAQIRSMSDRVDKFRQTLRSRQESMDRLGVFS